MKQAHNKRSPRATANSPPTLPAVGICLLDCFLVIIQLRHNFLSNHYFPISGVTLIEFPDSIRAKKVNWEILTIVQFIFILQHIVLNRTKFFHKFINSSY